MKLPQVCAYLACAICCSCSHFLCRSLAPSTIGDDVLHELLHLLLRRSAARRCARVNARRPLCCYSGYDFHTARVTAIVQTNYLLSHARRYEIHKPSGNPLTCYLALEFRMQGNRAFTYIKSASISRTSWRSSQYPLAGPAQLAPLATAGESDQKAPLTVLDLCVGFLVSRIGLTVCS